LPEPETDGPEVVDHPGAAATPVVATQIHEEPVHVEELAQPEAHAEPVHEPEVVAADEPEPQDQGEYHFDFDEVSPDEPVVAMPGLVAPQPPVGGTEDHTREHAAADFADEPEEPVFEGMPDTDEDEDITREHPVPAFSDDPVDTKLDLARAYLDMGDPEGARAMLEEVLNEGSQMQKDEAKRLLEGV
jgi:pilus assembly protein FimV